MDLSKFNFRMQRPTERGILLRPREPPGRRNLLPSQLDFGLVEAGTAPTARGGVTSPPSDALVSTTIKQDTSAGRFAVVEVQVFDVELVDPSELPPHTPPVFTLIMVSRSDGSAPVAVTTDQAVAAVVQFTAPAEATGERFTAALEFSGDRWPGVIDLPIKAQVGAFDLEVRWGLSNPFGILANHKSDTDPFEGNWFAGHVNAVLPVPVDRMPGRCWSGQTPAGYGWCELQRPIKAGFSAAAERRLG